MSTESPWPFLGRQRELGLLRQSLRSVRGGVVLIQGPRRAGASRLLQKAASSVRGSRWLSIRVPEGGPGPVLAAWNRGLLRSHTGAQLPGSLPAAVRMLGDWLRAGGHAVLDGVHHLGRPALAPILESLHLELQRPRGRAGRGVLVLIGVHGADLDAVLAGASHLVDDRALQIVLGDLEAGVLARHCGDDERALALQQLIGGLPSRWRIASRYGACAVGPTCMLDCLRAARDEFALEAEACFAPMWVGRMGEILHCLAAAGPLSYGALRAALVPADTKSRDEPSSYLRILEHRFRIVERMSGGTEGSASVVYRISDPFLRTWLSSLEIGRTHGSDFSGF